MITFDIDKATKKKLIQKARLVKVLYPKSKVLYRLSSSKKGGHIKVLGVSLDEKEEVQIRSLLGDDEHRIFKDGDRRFFGLPRQMMFDIKANLRTGEFKRADEWREII